MNVLEAKQYAIRHKLEGYKGLLKYTDAALQELVGKCGPGSGFLEWIVPETMWGVCMTPACLIHDKDYLKGKTKKDKREADARFRRNCNRINKIESHKKSVRNGYVKPRAKRFLNSTVIAAQKKLINVRTWTYWSFVHFFGRSAFTS